MRLLAGKFRSGMIVLGITLLIDQATKFFVNTINLSDPTTANYHIISMFEKIYNEAGVHFFLINVRHYFEISQLILRVVILPLIGIYIAYYIIKHRITSKWVLLGIGMLTGALFGNAFDIVFRGYVIDWIGCSFFMNSFELNYAINLADIFAVCSAPFILIGIRKNTLSLPVVFDKERAVPVSIFDDSNAA
ncbi:MAG: signal peptidase II [Candidatus Auribacterota bacterium]|jgi:lipoprotein signal peptidase|nr:signal peptidase II [Candidatus Auribacterota bacterium]